MVHWCDWLQAQREKEEQKLTEVLAGECWSPVCSCQWCCVKPAVCAHVFAFIPCAGLKSATSDLQKDKEKFERDLIPLSQSVNEARSKVSNPKLCPLRQSVPM